MEKMSDEQLERNIVWGLERLFGMTASGAGASGKTDSTDHEAVSKRVNDVLNDITAGRVIRPQRKNLSDALDRAASGDKVHDAIGRSRK